MNRRGVLVSSVVATLAAAGVAHALWSSTGAGAGAAATEPPVPVTVTPGTPTASLYPGGRSDVALVVTNPGSASIRLPSLALDTTQGTGGFAVDAAHSGCLAGAALTFSPQSSNGAGWTVPGRTGGTDGSLPVTLPAALAMGVDAAHECQGAEITVYVKAGS